AQRHRDGMSQRTLSVPLCLCGESVKPLDRLLQRWRISKALPWVRRGDRLLDLGCYDGLLLRRASERIARGLGVDPLVEPEKDGKLEVVRGRVPGEVRLEDES